MLRELTRADWLTILNLREELVPQTLILRGTRNLRRHFERYRALLADPHDIGSPNGLFEDVVVGKIGAAQVGYASVYGPAMASEITHLFGRLGTLRVIVTGVCGALATNIAAGDLVIATDAACGEGAVACYLPGTASVAATPELVERAIHTGGSVRPSVGPIWTTAALLAEGMDDLRRWRESGHIAVDMESASAFGVAEWIGMERVSVLSVFDNPLAGEHIGLDEQHKSERRRTGEEVALQIVLDLATHGA